MRKQFYCAHCCYNEEMDAYKDLAVEFGIAPFHYMCMQAHTDAVRDVIHKGLVNVNVPVDQDLPLHYAVLSKNRQVVDILLAAGADINKTDGWGIDALHVASTDTNDPQFVKFLIERGANVNANYSDAGETILHATCSRKDVNPAIIEALISAGADVHRVDFHHRTALHVACKNNYTDPKVIEILVDAGADIDAPDIYGHTCIDYAEHKRHHKVIAYLNQFGGGKMLKAAK